MQMTVKLCAFLGAQMLNSNRFSKFGRVGALAALMLLGSAAVLARPIITGPGSVTVGQDVVFTISDTAPADGFNADISFNSYLADFKFSFSSVYLQFAHADADATLGGSFLSVPSGPAEIFTPGEFAALFVGPGDVTPIPNETLFTLTFTALADTGSLFTIVTLSLPDTGAYGDGKSYVATTGIATITPAASQPGTDVPEPQSLALMLIGGAALLGARRRSQQS